MIMGKTDKIILLDRDKDLISKESSDFPMDIRSLIGLIYDLYFRLNRKAERCNEYSESNY